MAMRVGCIRRGALLEPRRMLSIANIGAAIAIVRAHALPGREAATVSNLMWQLWERIHERAETTDRRLHRDRRQRRHSQSTDRRGSERRRDASLVFLD
jgi:hypothetical protein